MCSVNGGLDNIIISIIIFDEKIKCVFLLDINVSQQFIVNFNFTINVLSLYSPFLRNIYVSPSSSIEIEL